MRLLIRTVLRVRVRSTVPNVSVGLMPTLNAISSNLSLVLEVFPKNLKSKDGLPLYRMGAKSLNYAGLVVGLHTNRSLATHHESRLCMLGPILAYGH